MLSQNFWLPSPWWPNHNLQNKIKIFPAWQWHQSISSTLSYPWQHRSHPIQIKRVYNWPKSWPASRTCHFWLSPVSFSVTSWKNHCFKKPPQSNCFCQSWLERTACIYSRSSCCRCVCTQCAQEQGQTTTRLGREKRPKTKASFCICTCYMYYIIINVSVIEVSAVIKANLGHLANTITNLDENTKFRWKYKFWRKYKSWWKYKYKYAIISGVCSVHDGHRQSKSGSAARHRHRLHIGI